MAVENPALSEVKIQSLRLWKHRDAGKAADKGFASLIEEIVKSNGIKESDYG